MVNPQLTNLLHLAKALINSMGLSRTPVTYDRGRFFLDGHDLNKAGTHSSNEPEYGRSDGWRALAGCFYVTSLYVSLTLQLQVKTDTSNRISASCRGLELQFNTAYILECCHKLEQAGELESDLLLVQLVRLQEIRYRMGRSFPYDESHATPSLDAPIEMFVRAWKRELETFWSSLSIQHRQNRASIPYKHEQRIN